MISGGSGVDPGGFDETDPGGGFVRFVEANKNRRKRTHYRSARCVGRVVAQQHAV